MPGQSTISGAGVYRRLLGYAVPYRNGFVIAVFGMILVAATEPSFAYLMQPMLDGSFVEKDPKIIRLVPLALLAIFLVRGIGSFLLRYYMEWVGRHVIHDLRRQLFSQLLRLPAAFYDANTTGHLTSKLIFDVEQVANATTSAITIIIKDTLTIIGLFGLMLYLSWQLTLFFLVITPAIGIIIVFISKRFRVISKRIQASMGNVSQISQQAIEGNRVVKVYRGEHYENQQFAKANEFNRRQNMKMAVTSAASIPVSQLFAGIAIAGMLYFATKETNLDTITVGSFMSFVAASMMLLAPMKRLTQVTAALQKGIAAAQSIFGLIDQDSEINIGTRRLAQAKGALVYKDVSFRYKETGVNVLDKVSLTIKPGSTVAIVGRSGGGKSTLVSLIPRFYEVSDGEVTLDGILLESIELENLRDQIAIVSQNITLFNDTILHNIAYGGDENVSEADIIKAATAAHAMEFIKDLPDGFETIVGEKGMLLSGGQRQRLAIARGLLKNAPILILDEATSALDTESERAIQDALEKLKVGRTTLVIAHRMSTIENADDIVVMDHGKIVEQGKHKALLAMNGHYAALHQMQFTETDAAQSSVLPTDSGPMAVSQIEKQ